MTTDEVPAVIQLLRIATDGVWDTDQMLAQLARVMYERDKYDQFLSDELLRRSYASQHLDPDAARAALGDALQKVITPELDPENVRGQG